MSAKLRSTRALRELGGQVRTVSIWGNPFTGIDITKAMGLKARAGLPLF